MWRRCLAIGFAGAIGCGGAGGSDSGETESEAGSADGSSGDTGEPVTRCEDVRYREIPDDPSERGPWPVGVKTLDIGGLTVDVWYPGEPGSEGALEPRVYDIREELPEAERSKISDEVNPYQTCDCYDDLPFDSESGPFPAIVFVHGTASFRHQSLPQVTHWASRGFVVVAADHPGLALQDLLGMVCGGPSVPQDLQGDLAKLVAAIRGEMPGLEGFADVIDATRIGMVGHSAGGRAIAPQGGVAAVLVPMGAGGVEAGAALESTLVLGGTADAIVPYTEQTEGYTSSPAPKRLVGVEGAGHLAFSEICALRNEAGQGLLEIATEAGVCGADLAGALFQCSPDLLDDALAWPVVDYATSAAFEEVLHCRTGPDPFDDIETRFAEVGAFERSP